jgi:hypothetical protein
MAALFQDRYRKTLFSSLGPMRLLRGGVPRTDAKFVENGDHTASVGEVKTHHDVTTTRQVSRDGCVARTNPTCHLLIFPGFCSSSHE